jgi:hypothetical protein
MLWARQPIAAVFGIFAHRAASAQGSCPSRARTERIVSAEPFNSVPTSAKRNAFRSEFSRRRRQWTSRVSPVVRLSSEVRTRSQSRRMAPRWGAPKKNAVRPSIGLERHAKVHRSGRRVAPVFAEPVVQHRRLVREVSHLRLPASGRIRSDVHAVSISFLIINYQP